MLQAVLPSAQWVLGFIDGEGCFHVAIQKNNTLRCGYQVQLQFCITQHIQDRELMDQLILFCFSLWGKEGVGTVNSDGPLKVQYRIRGMDDLEYHLFPFLEKNPLLTKKRLDYEQFRAVHALMRKGLHLTPEGLAQIRLIKGLMNRSRVK